MKTRLIFIFIFSFCLSFAQEKQDSIAPKWKYEPNFMVGVDVLNGSLAMFSDRKLLQGFVSTKIKKNIHAVADLGFEKNIYIKNGYNASANGVFAKLGAFYMLSMDTENPLNGFYCGGKLAASFYSQEYKGIPVRGYAGSDQSIAFAASSQSSYWMEATAGARIQLFKSNFYIDVNAQPRYLLYTTKQEEIVPMIIPGFGKSSTKFNLGFVWCLAFQF